MVADVSNNRIQVRGLNILIPRPELLQKIVVARMQGPKEESLQKKRWNIYLAPCRIIDHPVKAQTKGHNLFGVGHIVVEQQHLRCECISNQVWSAMLIYSSKHSKPFPSN